MQVTFPGVHIACKGESQSLLKGVGLQGCTHQASCQWQGVGMGHLPPKSPLRNCTSLLRLHNTVPPTRWLKPQKFVFISFGDWMSKIKFGPFDFL